MEVTTTGLDVVTAGPETEVVTTGPEVVEREADVVVGNSWPCPGFFFPAMTFMQQASNLAWQHCLFEGQLRSRFVQPKKSQVQSAKKVGMVSFKFVQT